MLWFDKKSISIFFFSLISYHQSMTLKCFVSWCLASFRIPLIFSKVLGTIWHSHELIFGLSNVKSPMKASRLRRHHLSNPTLWAKTGFFGFFFSINIDSSFCQHVYLMSIWWELRNGWFLALASCATALFFFHFYPTRASFFVNAGRAQEERCEERWREKEEDAISLYGFQSELCLGKVY